MNDAQPPAPEPTRTHSGRLFLAPPRDPGSPRREYECLFVRSGFVQAADGADTHWLIPPEVLKRDLQLFDGVASYLDHPELFGFGWRGEPKVAKLIGVTKDVYWDAEEEAVCGTLRLYNEDPNSPGAFVAHLLDQMLLDRQHGEPVPATGLSAVFYHDAELDESSGNRITRRFKKVESVDLVYAPGAGGYVRAALSAYTPTHRKDRSMPPENEHDVPPDVSQDPLTGAVATLAVKVAQLQHQVAALSLRPSVIGGPPSSVIGGQPSSVIGGQPPSVIGGRPPEPIAGPPPAGEPAPDLAAEIAQLRQVVAAMQHPVQGMGQAPRDATLLPSRFLLSSPLDELQAAWDWVFGAPNAPLPNPELRRTDYLYRLLTGDLSWTGVFDEREALATANPTTLPGMAVNAMNKVIIPLYNRLDAYRWYEPIVTVQPTDGSLHDMAWIQFGGIGDLPVVADGAAYTELTVGDSKESDSFTKYGGYVGITEKMIRNSDIARIQAVPRALTVAAVQTRSAKIAALFTANSGVGPTLDQDSKALFHADHGSNVQTTAFSWTAWKAARIECAKHAELTSSKRIALFPRYCLVPADLYDTALQTFGYGAGPGGQPGTANNDVNPYGVGRPGDPRPIPIMVPDWTDENDWAYIADPAVAPIIQMAYADSPGGGVHPAPQLFTVTSKLAGLMFTNDVLPIKVRDYWAYGVATWRGIGKRNVT